jgi:hypothetical protein
VAVTKSQITDLREAYREAGIQIGQFRDPIEQSIGEASLLIEATRMYSELMQVPGMKDSVLAPLKDYVQALVVALGAVETLDVVRFVEFLDAQVEKLAKKTIASLTQLLVTGVWAAGAFTIVAAIVSALLIAAGQAAAGLFLSVAALGGIGSFYIGRTVKVAIDAGSASWAHSWGWANSLGAQSDQQLARARILQAEIAQAASGHAWQIAPFAAKARSRAKWLVRSMWILAGFGLLLVVVGFIGGIVVALPTTPTNR